MRVTPPPEDVTPKFRTNSPIFWMSLAHLLEECKLFSTLRHYNLAKEKAAGVYLVVPEQIDFRSDAELSHHCECWSDFHFLMRPTEKELKENSREFSQVEAAAYQQRVDLIAGFALQIVSFHPMVLLQVTNHWLNG